MTLDITIRKALIEDAPSFLPLIEQLGYPLSLEILKAQFEVFTKQDGYEIFLAEKAGIVVGWVAWSKSYLFVSPTTRIHIEGLVVDKNFRGEGIGRKLMEKAEEFAKQSSPCIVDLTSGLRRAKDGSHDFYQSMGYYNEGYMAKLYLRKEIF
ncbi:GNAT family N-acetyltransferase [Legionella gresilensis]|uniref:GNAT family N-acetyltransferase n=1 Tax=Legionella gresilensis TaxID=91823 RepID=UPI0010411E38|nr:GNAT family N-acetyltransferase [Legionella gresilensis]